MYRAKEMGGDRVCSSADIGMKAPKEMVHEISDVSALKQWLEKITRQVNQNLTESVFAFARTLELDVYQALISDRPYRKAYPREEAVEIIKAGSGTQFDKKVVDAFLQVVQK